MLILFGFLGNANYKISFLTNYLHEIYVINTVLLYLYALGLYNGIYG